MIMLGVELDYLPCFRGLILAEFGPQAPIGKGGGLHPHYSCQAPPWWGFRGSAPERIFFFKCHVKYCNFIVNMDHSLCHRYDGRSYVNIRFFSLEGNPLLYMRELYYDCILF
jgi:hypothetical protein